MTADPMTWPTDRPGYPMDAERDGWHWLMIGHGVGHPFPMLWCADGEMWEAGDDGYVAAADISTRWNYLGPCYTQADLDAAVQAERVRVIGACRAEMCRVRSPDHGPTPALDAALAKARRETWEKAVEICAAVSGKEHRAALNYPAREEGGDGSREDSLNAALAAMDCAAAIRSAAAGEEGK